MNIKRKYKVILTIISSVVILILAINIYVLTAPQFGKRAKKAQLESIADQSIYKKGKFHNSDPVPVMLPKSYGKMIKASRKNREGHTPTNTIPTVKPVLSKQDSGNNISVIWLGHSSVLLKIDEIVVLTDPVFTKRPSPVSFIGPKTFSYTTPINPNDIPLPDIIMISHDHFDHLDYKTIQEYYSEVSLFVVPLGIGSMLKGWGIDKSQILEFDWWQQEAVMDKQLLISSTPAQHFSGRRKQDNSTLWCSWVIEHNGQKIFFSGDSGYGNHFKEINEKFGSFDLALMECGAYGKFWPHIHMKPEETVQASIDIKAQLTLPIHWGKYNLAFHSWTEPAERFIKAASEQGLSYTTPQIGQEVVLNNTIPEIIWWR